MFAPLLPQAFIVAAGGGHDSVCSLKNLLVRDDAAKRMVAETKGALDTLCGVLTRCEARAIAASAAGEGGRPAAPEAPSPELEEVYGVLQPALEMLNSLSACQTGIMLR